MNITIKDVDFNRFNKWYIVRGILEGIEVGSSNHCLGFVYDDDPSAHVYDFISVKHMRLDITITFEKG